MFEKVPAPNLEHIVCEEIDRCFVPDNIGVWLVVVGLGVVCGERRSHMAVHAGTWEIAEVGAGTAPSEPLATSRGLLL